MLKETSHEDKIRKYVASGKPYNNDIVMALDPIMIILKVLHFGQFIIICVSFKKLEVCHILVHYHLLMMALMSVLPYNEDEAERKQDFYLKCIMIFLFHYSKNFHLTCISSAITALVFETMSMLHYSEITSPGYVKAVFNFFVTVGQFEMIRIWLNL